MRISYGRGGLRSVARGRQPRGAFREPARVLPLHNTRQNNRELNDKELRDLLLDGIGCLEVRPKGTVLLLR